MKLTHTQAYLLGSISKHASNYRLALQSLKKSVETGQETNVLSGIHFDAATKAKYASDIVSELLDQLYEEFADLDPAEISRIVTLAVQPTDKGYRRRFNVDEEF